MAVVKGGAYGLGLMQVVTVLLEEGVQELAVATVAEGVHLRQQGVHVPITVLSNLLTCELQDVTQHRLIPSVSWAKTLASVPSDSLVYPDGSRLRVAINIDTGLSRYGVQPEDLPQLVSTLDELNVTVNSMYTHFQGNFEHKKENQTQLDMFLRATEPYKDRPLVLHAAATTGCVQGLGTHLDFIRPGSAITGLIAVSAWETVHRFAKSTLQPAMSVLAKPSFFRLLPAGRFIGYADPYQTSGEEWIVHFSVGWADGLSQQLGSSGVGAVMRVKTGELCPIVGRVSMDSITARLHEAPGDDEVFQVMTDDFHEVTSAVGMARNLGVTVSEIPGKWSTRLARVYSRNGKIVHVCHSFDYTC
ncbi:alanine racemase-like [Panulirus ornatus]|uniref:alanine racemase-like n=1 Tax=Panulirus ornatus TaxID=150431 RepID=UPI003A8827F3